MLLYCFIIVCMCFIVSIIHTIQTNIVYDLFSIFVKPVCYVDMFDVLHKEKYIHTYMFLQLISGIL